MQPPCHYRFTLGGNSPNLIEYKLKSLNLSRVMNTQSNYEREKNRLDVNGCSLLNIELTGHWRDIDKLVAKGYMQTYGVDYQETFAPVAKMNTICILLSLAANFGWSLQQLDVKNALLHGDLEEVYMETPPSFNGDCERNNVCRLRKALYDIKQSP